MYKNEDSLLVEEGSAQIQVVSCGLKTGRVTDENASGTSAALNASKVVTPEAVAGRLFISTMVREKFAGQYRRKCTE